MKKLFLIILTLCIALTLAACGNDSQPDSVCTHTFGDWVVEKQATCKEEGLLARTCTKCAYMEATKIEKTNDHAEAIDPAIPATCEKTGLSEGKHCAVCDAVLVAQQETPIVSHTYDNKYDESCNVCGHIRDAECAHKETETLEAKAATCTEIGLTEGSKCKKCGEILVSQTAISVIDHSAGDWIIDKEATTIEEGKKHTECTMCGKWMAEESIPATGSVGLEYALNDDGESYAVTGIGTCTDSDIVIPAMYERLPVTAIGANAFRGCNGLTSITIPESVAAIDYQAFLDCKNLTSITIGNGVTAIGSSAFRGCNNLTSITIPVGVSTIGKLAFYNCTSLTSVTIPDSVTNIEENVFNGCTSLTGIWVDEKNSAYCSDSVGVLFNKEQTELIRMPGGYKGTYTIPVGVSTIDKWAFSDCTGLTNISIPDSVTTIGEYGFSNCTSLTDVTIGNNVTTIGKYGFSDCTGLTNISIPNSVTSIGASAFDGCTNLIYNNYDNGKYLGNSSNPYLILITTASSNITSCEIYPKTRIISDYAFSDCTSLTDVTIGNNVTTIGDCAFIGCYSLTSVIIPESVTTIGDYAFFDCYSLTSVIIPESVTTIGEQAFIFCGSLGEIRVDEKNPNYSDKNGVLFNKEQNKLIEVPGALYEYAIPGTVTTIGDSAFVACRNLTYVTIPDSVTAIGNDAFSLCPNLTYITFQGTMAQWNDIDFGSDWNSDVSATEVVCSDGTVSLK